MPADLGVGLLCKFHLCAHGKAKQSEAKRSKEIYREAKRSRRFFYREAKRSKEIYRVSQIPSVNTCREGLSGKGGGRHPVGAEQARPSSKRTSIVRSFDHSITGLAGFAVLPRLISHNQCAMQVYRGKSVKPWKSSVTEVHVYL